jgi:hypothetical protein
MKKIFIFILLLITIYASAQKSDRKVENTLYSDTIVSTKLRAITEIKTPLLKFTNGTEMMTAPAMKYYSVINYGAVADGITDDYNAFLSCYNACVSDGASMYIPTGNYLISSTIEITESISIKGEGLNSIILVSGDLPAFRFRTLAATPLNITDLSFKKTGSSTNYRNSGIEISQSETFVCSGLRFEDLNTGLRVDSVSGYSNTSNANSIINCQFYNCNTGLRLVNRAEYTSVVGCGFSQCDTGMYTNSANNIYSNSIYTNNAVGVFMSSGLNGNKSFISNCQLNHNGMGIKATSIGETFTIATTTIFASGLSISNASPLFFDNCKLNNDGGYGWTFSGSNVVFNNCVISDFSLIKETYVSNSSSNIRFNNCYRYYNTSDALIDGITRDQSRMIWFNDSSNTHEPIMAINPIYKNIDVNADLKSENILAKNYYKIVKTDSLNNNLVVNPDCEFSTNGWKQYEATVQLSASYKKSGNTSFYIKGGTSYGQFYQNISSGITIGHIYYVACWVRPGSIDTVTISAYSNFLGSLYSTNQYNDITHGQFNLVSTLATATQAKIGIVVNLRTAGTAPIGANLYVDNFMIIDLTELYGSGSEPDKSTFDAVASTYIGEYDKLYVQSIEEFAKYQTYYQSTEPDIPNNTFAFWIDSNDSKYYLILDFEGTQKKIELL